MWGITVKEAISILNDLHNQCCQADSIFCTDASGARCEAEDMAISALELQEPKRPIGEHYAHMRCPSCNHRIPSGIGSSSHRRDNWCNYCGQAILWDEIK